MSDGRKITPGAITLGTRIRLRSGRFGEVKSITGQKGLAMVDIRLVGSQPPSRRVFGSIIRTPLRDIVAAGE